MPEQNIPKNLPIQGESLLEKVNEGDDKVVQDKAPQNTPIKKEEDLPISKSQADPAEVQDIFADVKDEVPAHKAPVAPAPISVPKPETSSVEQPVKDAMETAVETPQQGFKKIIIVIGSIVLFATIMAGGGYWAYNQFLKPKELSPLLNMNINTGLPVKTQEPETPEVPVSVPIVETDSDNDGLTDKRELELGTDPRNPDSDGDRLFDREEVEVYKTDPLNKDTDRDGFEDGPEVQAGYDPKGPGKLIRIPKGE